MRAVRAYIQNSAKGFCSLYLHGGIIKLGGTHSYVVALVCELNYAFNTPLTGRKGQPPFADVYNKGWPVALAKPRG